ncbi:MAG: hypothetical protein AMJ65_16110 [Phycisphaerae bacterium SG8_4]|nr:MAG: hypothetical protein AMJ65_16110 [Phycisphaerae bacterium SG8_4]
MSKVTLISLILFPTVLVVTVRTTSKACRILKFSTTLDDSETPPQWVGVVSAGRRGYLLGCLAESLQTGWRLNSKVWARIILRQRCRVV